MINAIPGVTMADYTGFYPEEMSGIQASGELAKALDSGGYSTANSGGPLIGQSLENTVHIVTFDIQKHIPLFKRIVKQPAFATIEEYNRLLSYGEGGAFFQDGGLPRGDDAQYERVAEKVKFMGCQGEVTGPMMLAGRAKFGDILAMQVYNRTAFLLRKIEEALFFSNDTTDTLAFRGIFQQVKEAAPENIIDLRGKPIELSNLEDAAQIIADNYGFPTVGLFSVREKSALSKLLYPLARFNSPGQAAAAGIPINEYASAQGTFDLVSDVWLKPGGAPLSVANSGSPATPAAPAVTVVNDATSLMEIGTYYYRVSAVNSAGESLSVAGDVAASVTTTGKKVSIVITNVSGAKSYVIYRGTTASNTKKMIEVPATIGGTTTVLDLNADIPGTSNALIADEQQMALKQLLPIRKVDLARIADSTRWMQIAYLTMAVYAPKRLVQFKNIGAAV